MAAKKRGLGRGLDALLGNAVSKESEDAPAELRSPDNLTSLPVDLIQRGRYQPRRDFNPDSLQELADSIAAQGVVQPIVVRPVGENKYEIIAGERRWRASQQAGLSEIPVVIRDVNDQTAMAMGLIENIQRDDLNPLEEAGALHRLLNEFELTHQEIARAVGKSRTTVTNLLRLLELNPEVKTMIEEGRIEMGHARALLGLKGALQSEAARQVSLQGLSVRETEKLVRRLQGEGLEGPKSKTAAKEDPNVRSLETDLTERLGARVKLQQGAGGKGKLVISYNSLDELDGILEHIQ
ncbi:MAG: ParB/RepB/Spo0J family partition protein [Sedimenticola sp.]|uniref:Probable chromosome-partitioning protein ParB n=1 Tax=Sedimenticola thiotaurini TaxID=1543721 RepID=A0A558DFC7_9GAMM|nr:ParB/RepB/Spo0J family partition protein [Sedimenticola sp.]TVT59736.1 MAG: ParB/RepB/Spo0J family partition protein [Sedimenticola thiotaurini]MCW8948210.1 ParB/RepB/Spo0J family partition protein [Sedimenticola sp.]MCW8976168.1 ParB/RepB/Spo0J family partition protein [Sedimenticola sp.]MCW9022532.1 ParB/RepB/Spo0J family partition protein [Sedimenticola sp.]